MISPTYKGRSPTGRILHLGLVVVEHAIENAFCLVCTRYVGPDAHARGCPVGPAVEETLQARANMKGGNRG